MKIIQSKILIVLLFSIGFIACPGNIFSSIEKCNNFAYSNMGSKRNVATRFGYCKVDKTERACTISGYVCAPTAGKFGFCVPAEYEDCWQANNCGKGKCKYMSVYKAGSCNDIAHLRNDPCKAYAPKNYEDRISTTDTKLYPCIIGTVCNNQDKNSFNGGTCRCGSKSPEEKENEDNTPSYPEDIPDEPEPEKCMMVTAGEECDSKGSPITKYCKGMCKVIGGKNMCTEMLPIGAPCSADLQNKGFQFCNGGYCNGKDCVKFSGLGEACDTKLTCSTELASLQCKSKCTLYVGTGSYCNEGMEIRCQDSDATCDSKLQMCVKKVGQGESCKYPGHFCNQNLYCSELTQTCVVIISAKSETACVNKNSVLCNFYQSWYCINGKCGQFSKIDCNTVCVFPLVCDGTKCVDSKCSGDIFQDSTSTFVCVYGFKLAVTIRKHGESCNEAENRCPPNHICYNGICVTFINIGIYTKCSKSVLCPDGKICVNEVCQDCPDCISNGVTCNAQQLCKQDTKPPTCFDTHQTPITCPELICRSPLIKVGNTCQREKCETFPKEDWDPQDCTMAGCSAEYACKLDIKRCVKLVINLGGKCDESNPSSDYLLFCKHPLQCLNSKCVLISMDVCDGENKLCPNGYECQNSICVIIVQLKQSCDDSRLLCKPESTQDKRKCEKGWCFVPAPKTPDCEPLNCPSPNKLENDVCFQEVNIGMSCDNDKKLKLCPSYLHCRNGICVKYSETECDETKFIFCFDGFKCQNKVCVIIDSNEVVDCTKKKCEEPKFCNEVVKLCAIKITIGGECDQVLKVCDKGLFCGFKGVCVQIVEKGNPCDENKICNFGLVCHPKNHICIEYTREDCPKTPMNPGDACKECCKSPLICDPIKQICVPDVPEPDPIDPKPPINPFPTPDIPNPVPVDPKNPPTCSCLLPDCHDSNYECNVAKQVCQKKDRKPTPGRNCGQLMDIKGNIGVFAEKCPFDGLCEAGACVYFVDVNEKCDGLFLRCNEGLYCSKEKKVCIGGAYANGKCDVETNNCEKNFKCSPVLEKCIPEKPDYGMICSPGNYMCENDFFCIDNVCAKLSMVGESCSCGKACFKGSYCDPNLQICVSVLGPGEVCDSTKGAICDPDLDLTCLATEGKPSRCVSVGSEEDQACDGINALCANPLVCVQGICENQTPQLGECCRDRKGNLLKCVKGDCDPSMFICVKNEPENAVCEDNYSKCPSGTNCLPCKFELGSVSFCLKSTENCPKELTCPTGTTKVNNKCQVQLGGECDNKVFVCDSSLSCSSGYCVKLVELKETCNIESFLICKKDLKCLQTFSGTFICSTVVEQGGSCDSENGYFCRPGLICFDNNQKRAAEKGICIKKVYLGHYCGNTGTLCFPTNLRCGGFKTCQETKQQGEACDGYSTICDVSKNLECRDGFCIKYVGKDQKCLLHSAICETGKNLVCKDGTCTEISGPGADCTKNSKVCQGDTHCDQNLKKCVKYVGKGEICDDKFIICDPNATGKDKLYCKDFPNSTKRHCTRLREHKDPCSNDEYDICNTEMTKNLVCIKTLCTIVKTNVQDPCDPKEAIICDPGKLTCDGQKCVKKSTNNGGQPFADESDQNNDAKSQMKQMLGKQMSNNGMSQDTLSQKIGDGLLKKMDDSLGLINQNEKFQFIDNQNSDGNPPENMIDKDMVMDRRFKRKRSARSHSHSKSSHSKSVPIRLHLPCQDSTQCRLIEGFYCDSEFHVCRPESDEVLQECQRASDCPLQGMSCFSLSLESRNEWIEKQDGNVASDETSLCLFSKNLKAGQFCFSSNECIEGLKCEIQRDNMKRCVN